MANMRMIWRIETQLQPSLNTAIQVILALKNICAECKMQFRVLDLKRLRKFSPQAINLQMG